MSKVKDTQHNTFGAIAAIQTIVENYPSLKNSDSIMEKIFGKKKIAKLNIVKLWKMLVMVYLQELSMPLKSC